LAASASSAWLAEIEKLVTATDVETGEVDVFLEAIEA
jgi:hypothetical protein